MYGFHVQKMRGKKTNMFSIDIYHTLLSSHSRIFQQKTDEQEVTDLFEELSCDSEVCTDPASWVWVGE